MLSNQKLKAFIPTINPERAKAFYGEVLGLKFIHQDNFAVEFDADGTSLRINIVRDLHPHPFTVLGWDVKNINLYIEALEKKGVRFERYDFIEQDELGIWTSPSGSKVAWFKDPDGNLLSLSELPG
jgi:catechol 2,3-dioxygenase-like lactoylglutathione lyase family enzyme